MKNGKCKIQFAQPASEIPRPGKLQPMFRFQKRSRTSFASAVQTAAILITSHLSLPSSPLLRLHLLFRNAEFKDDSFREFHQRVRAARVEDRVAKITDVLLQPGGINAPAT